MEDLVSVVATNSMYVGTDKIYRSIWWQILKEDTLSIDSLQERIDNILSTSDLFRAAPNNVPGLSSLINEYGYRPVYDRCLRLSLRNIHTLTGFALLWSLYALLEPTHNRDLREVVEAEADNRVEQFSLNQIPELGETFQENAIQHLLNYRFNMGTSKAIGFGYHEDIGRWPILPIRFREDLITATALFPAQIGLI